MAIAGDTGDAGTAGEDTGGDTAGEDTGGDTGGEDTGGDDTVDPGGIGGRCGFGRGGWSSAHRRAHLPGGASLSGSRAMTDSTFWRFDDFQDKTVPRGDTTGMAFIWGGQLQGSPATEGDSFTVSVSFSVTYNFTKSNAFDQPSLNFELQSGYGSSAYTIDYDFIQTPRYDASDYTSDSQWPELSDTSALAVGASMTETYAFTLSTTMMPSEGTDVSYWFVQLNLNWDNEYANHYSWDDNYSKLNGDTFLAVGTASVAYHSVSAVPEPADAATAFGVVALLALGARRRSHRRV